MNIRRIIRIIFKHRRLFQSRDTAQKGKFIFLICSGIFLVFIYLGNYLFIPQEFIISFILMVLLMDFTFKFFFKKEDVNILPYLVLPLNRKMLIKAILYLDTVNIWNIYCFVSILFLLFTNFFSTVHFSRIGFSINLYLLFIFNSYYIMAINSTLNRIIAFILFPVLLLFALPIYLLLYSGWWGTVIISVLTLLLFYSDIYLINNKIYKQLNEQAI